MSAEDDYYAALERLKRGKPKIVDKGIKITNSSVAREAGRSGGAIREGRYPELVELIEEAAEAQPVKEIDKVRISAKKEKSDAEDYRSKYEEALGREVMLMLRLDELEKKLIKNN